MPETKLNALIKYLRTLNNSIVAYSGGVDSTLLVKAAQMAGIRFIAVTSSSETVPLHDLENSKSITSILNIEHRIIETDELSDQNFAANPPDRCFFCKNNLFGYLREIARSEGYEHIIDGSNADDINDYRPGLKAAKKHGVISPFIDVGLHKRDIRVLSKDLGLPTWDHPSSPCLSSRFPYGVAITVDGLKMVSAAEDYLRSLGFRIVRVRTSGTSATIEVGADELDRLTDRKVQHNIIEKFNRIGYKEIHFDSEGYSTGKLNRAIET